MQITKYAPNPEKKLFIRVNGANFARIPIKTHFIRPKENIEAIIKQYVLGIAEIGDIIVLSQKLVSLTQNRVVYKKDIKIGFWAKLLSKFVRKTTAGFSVGNPLKMQTAINLAGLPRVFLASILAGIGKIFLIKGIFYRIVGNGVNQIDGFYGKFFPEYKKIGILSPLNPNSVCEHLKKQFNFSFIIADINDLGGNIIGTDSSLSKSKRFLFSVLKDNPMGQKAFQTPILIIRKNDKKDF